MRGWMIVLALAGCMGSEPQISTVAADDSCTKHEQLRGCCAAGSSCTWFAAVGEPCTTAYTPFCDAGLGWCSTDFTCRPFCAVILYPRCPGGMIEVHEPDGSSDVCVCEQL